MDTFKFVIGVTIMIGISAFNMVLYIDHEAVYMRTVEAPNTWTKTCQYYTPFRLFELRVNTGRSCPARVVVK